MKRSFCLWLEALLSFVMLYFIGLHEAFIPDVVFYGISGIFLVVGAAFALKDRYRWRRTVTVLLSLAVCTGLNFWIFCDYSWSCFSVNNRPAPREPLLIDEELTYTQAYIDLSYVVHQVKKVHLSFIYNPFNPAPRPYLELCRQRDEALARLKQLDRITVADVYPMSTS